MLANNYYRNTICPLCHSKRIFKRGNISYKDPIFFSTITIKLELIPELFQCRNCDSAFTQNILSEENAKDFYSQGDSANRWSLVPFDVQKHDRQVDCIRRYLSGRQKVLDVGCNTGEFLDYAKSLGCKTAGIEYSENSRAVLKEKGHFAFSSIDEVEEKFDVITAFDLIEHLYDVPKFFAACNKILNKDGVLIILTGNIRSLSAQLSGAQWWYTQYPEHIVFPSKKYFLKHSGFLMQERVETYASKGYQRHPFALLKGLANAIVKMQYNGLPSIGPDHLLLVLKNAT